MTISRVLSIVFVLVGILSSCNHEGNKEGDQSGSPQNASSSYKPPAFTDINREEKIQERAGEIQELIEEQAKKTKIPGIVYGIVVDSSLVVSGGTGFINIEDSIPATPQSCFRIASMTKSFTALAILKLRDEGLLFLHDAAEKYIPEMAEIEYLTSDASLINIENLLTMTAGFPEDNPWGDRQLDEPNQMLLDLLKDRISFSNTTSHQFEYSNTGYALLGQIISRISGKKYQDYITENILHPLGMKQTYWEYENVPEDLLALGYRWEDNQWKLEPMLHDGSYGAMGGLITTIEDFGKYISYQLSAWPPRSTVDAGPVKRSSLREMQTLHNANMFPNVPDGDGEPCSILVGYGFGFLVFEDCKGLKQVMHSGALPGFGSDYVLYPDYGIGIMAFGNLTYTTPLPYEEFEDLLFKSIDLPARKLPASEILLERQAQIIQLIQEWDPDLEANILAENFYLDKSRKHRQDEIIRVLEKAGPIISTGEMEPENQLRGGFDLKTANGTLQVYFTLTPEGDPKIQFLDVYFSPS